MTNESSKTVERKASVPLAWLGYLGLWIGGLVIVLTVLRIGQSRGFLTRITETSGPAATTVATVDVVLHVLLTLAAVCLLGGLLGRLCRLIGQPAVIGEVVAGLLLGPSLLGAISPEAMHILIPPPSIDATGAVAVALKVIAQLGIVLYMFLVGLELNAAQLKKKARAAIAISHASIVVPFALGAILSLWLYPIVSERDVPFMSFALFIGIAMSITAFPVLARILTDRNLQDTAVGTVALSCAAADDVTGWCLLSLVVGVAKSDVGSAGFVFIGSLAFIATMLLIVRPAMTKFVEAIDSERLPLNEMSVTMVYVLILGSAAATEWIGIHAIFGAFLLGFIIPSGCRLADYLSNQLKAPVTLLLLPAFFAYTGMRTEIGLLTEWSHWLICLVIIAVATLGKFGGTYAAARMVGESPQDASVLGILMNTRGLMELIVLNIGLDLGIINPTLFAMMVIMALVTTLMTSPILRLRSPQFS